MIRLKAYAKLNLALNVVGKRHDGYHELDTIMQSISLSDIVTIKKTLGTTVKMNIGSIDEKNNTAYIAAKLFKQHTGVGGAEIFIEKHIPSMAGLGGSSADAAAVLIGLNELYGTNIDIDTLCSFGKKVGADVPFALMGGSARAKGIGEILTSLKLPKKLHFVLVKPKQGVSTVKVFEAYKKTSSKISIESVQYALQKGDIELIKKFSDNALGLAALSLAPDILKAAGALSKAGKSFMSGSGSSMFAILETADEAEKIANSISGDFELVGAYHSTDTGVEIIGDNK